MISDPTGDGERHVAVLGPMGVGKSTTAAALARRLGRPHRDGDTDVEARTGRTGREIASSDGVAALHRLEAEVMIAALDEATPLVVSAGASVVEVDVCRDRLRSAAFVVVLALPIPLLVERIAQGEHRRPMSVAELESAQERRGPFFGEVADLVLDAARPTDDLVDEIVAQLGQVSPTRYPSGHGSDGSSSYT